MVHTSDITTNTRTNSHSPADGGLAWKHRSACNVGQHVRSQIEHLRKTIVKDEIAKTKFELQETRDHEAVRVMEAEAGRVGRDYGMLLAWQRHAHKAKPDAVSAKDADKANA